MFSLQLLELLPVLEVKQNAHVGDWLYLINCDLYFSQSLLWKGINSSLWLA